MSDFLLMLATVSPGIIFLIVVVSLLIPGLKTQTQVRRLDWINSLVVILSSAVLLVVLVIERKVDRDWVIALVATAISFLFFLFGAGIINAAVGERKLSDRFTGNRPGRDQSDDSG